MKYFDFENKKYKIAFCIFEGMYYYINNRHSKERKMDYEDYVRVDFGDEGKGRMKWGTEMFSICDECGYEEMVCDGFDGDNGDEFWVCPECNHKRVDYQAPTPESRQDLIDQLEQEIYGFYSKHKGLKGSARREAHDYIKPKRVLLDYLKNLNRRKWEPVIKTDWSHLE